MGFEEFLREVASPLGLQWRPFKRKGIRRKVERRISQIGLSNYEEYFLRIKKDPQEHHTLSEILTVTISRFFRDKEVFNTVGQTVLPALLREKEREELRIWSIGCANGEEPYSLLLLWEEHLGKDWPKVHLSILATDLDEHLFERAKKGTYKRSSLTEVSDEILQRFFKVGNDSCVLEDTVRNGIEFRRHDILREEPFLGMDMVFCRNLAFTYFSKEGQMDVLRKIATSLIEAGYLVIGKDESLPLTYPTLFVPVFPTEKIYQKFTM